MLFHIERRGKKREQRGKGCGEQRAAGERADKGQRRRRPLSKFLPGKKGAAGKEEEREGNRKRWQRNGNRLSTRLLAHALRAVLALSILSKNMGGDRGAESAVCLARAPQQPTCERTRRSGPSSSVTAAMAAFISVPECFLHFLSLCANYGLPLFSRAKPDASADAEGRGRPPRHAISSHLPSCITTTGHGRTMAITVKTKRK